MQVAALETPEISGRQKIIADLKTIIFNLGRQNISYQIDNMEGVKIELLTTKQQRKRQKKSIDHSDQTVQVYYVLVSDDRLCYHTI